MPDGTTPSAAPFSRKCSDDVTASPTEGVARAASPAGPLSARLAPATALALQLWLTSMLCWWVIGISFSRLWVAGQHHPAQLDSLLLRLGSAGGRLDGRRVAALCGLSPAPAPAARWRPGRRRCAGSIPAPRRAAGDRHQQLRVPARRAPDRLLRQPAPARVRQDHGPGPRARRAVRRCGVSDDRARGERLGLRACRGRPGLVPIQPLYGKIISITLAVALGVAVPVFLTGSPSWAAPRERPAPSDAGALEALEQHAGLGGPLSGSGPSPRGFDGPALEQLHHARRRRRPGALRRRPASTRADPAVDRGWFGEPRRQHKVVAFVYRPAVLPDGDGAVLVAVSPFRITAVS